MFFLAWVAIFVSGVIYMQNLRNSFLTWAFIIAMVIMLVAVCWIKGEKPKWRWGG